MSSFARTVLVFLLVIAALFALSQDTQLLVRQGHNEGINMVKYSPTGKHVYSASEDKTIKMWDVSTGIDVGTFNAHEAGVITIELSKDGKNIAIR